ncbi:hypothetical protein ITJ42_07245 [Clavibacter michiganensis subsp. phaseoli]|uniref:Alkaline shock response membrane anchor protein AmaP n=1 Tax=Clavibacter phaseoli TaxID=1734031 RepID=A0A8I0VCJ4_9MICO|nr:hypothetical protein [Clavibacter phaseoli]MBF4631005.1 hypothetical protein [Clavibacter phaseoli]
MTSTNRALNRLLVIVVGLVLIAAGVALGAGSLLPGVQSSVSGAASDAKQPVGDALSGGQPWILWVVALVALVLIVVLAWFALRQGHGRTGTLVRLEGGRDASTPTGGSVVIDAKVAEQLLGDALRDDSAIVSVDVTAFEVAHATTLRVTAVARRGVSPVAVRRTVDEAVGRLDAVIGTEVPVVIQITGGLRSSMTSETRLA